MKALVLAVILLALGHGAADAGKCKAKGKVLFRETTGPLKDAPVDTTGVGQMTAGEADMTFTIYATGAWVTEVERAGQKSFGLSGCLPKPHLKELKRSVGKAKFKLAPDDWGTCKAISTREVVYASPKRRKKVTTAAPCGTAVDEWTANAAACAEIAVRFHEMSAKEIRAVCRGEE